MGLRKVIPESRWQPSEPTIHEVSSTLEAESKMNRSLESIASKEHLVNGFSGTHDMKDVNGNYKSNSADWNAEFEQIVRGPFDYQYGKPGKDFRKQLLQAFNFWLQVDEREFDIIDNVVAMLHNASLLIDDIQDGSKLRRGSPAAHCVFGTAQTINAANYVYFVAQNELSKLQNWPEAFKIFTEEMMNLHRGQGMELFWRDEGVVPTEAEYKLMISNKTGGLFRLGARLLQSASRSSYDVIPLADVLGIIFQISDDYKNLCSDKMAAEKGFAEDLTEGKFSFPVIHALRNCTTGCRELLNILRLHTEDVELKKYAVNFMRDETKSLEYTKATVGEYGQDAKRLLDKFDQRNPAMEQLLGKIVVT